MSQAAGAYPATPHPSVQVEKVENGYLVTLYPQTPDQPPLPVIAGEYPDPAKLEELRQYHDTMRPKSFVFTAITDAWSAVETFLMDGKLPEAA